MSLHAHAEGHEQVPVETARVARAAFPKGTLAMGLRDILGPIYEDGRFRALFAACGHPAEAPWRLALATVLQFAENLSDRQAAEAVRGRIDWKYALGLALSDPGFDYSVLCEFRTRLVLHGAEQTLLDAVLEACRERGFLKARGRQRTDATHILGALRVLNRLELLAETLRAALNGVAQAAPEWLQAWTPEDWFTRYGRRVEESRLPDGKEKRAAYAVLVGTDGMRLLEEIDAPSAPPTLRALPCVRLLRQVWISQYLVGERGLVLREPQDMPPANRQIETPYEPEARYGEKRGQPWIGYKTHLTETCEETLPPLVTEVETTLAPTSDMGQLAPIQAGLARVGLLPAEHVVDAGYVRARNILASAAAYGIDLVGPVPEDHSWQARAGQGYDAAHFAVDWEHHVVTCPQGHQSQRWTTSYTARKRTMIHVTFASTDCTPCPVRPLCTKATALPRALTLPVQAEYEALQVARARQQTEAFATLYACRAGIEGTLSQGIRLCGLRRARYRGLAKAHLQDVAIAAALNVRRVVAWLDGVPRAQTRTSHFAALAPAA